MKKIFLLAGICFIANAGTVFSAEIPDNSLYQFKQDWINQHGKKQSLESLRGKARVFAMVYTRCTSACPLIVQAMKKIEQQLPPEAAEKVGFVLFSMDPKRDTPESLRGFIRTHGIEKDNWLVLTSNEDNVQELTAAIAFNFKEAEGGVFIHQNTISVLDAEGVLAHQYPNLEEAVSQVVKALPSE